MDMKVQQAPASGRGVQWYVARTQPRRESVAFAHLTRQGFNAFLPRIGKVRRHARRIENVLAPLFPSYIFIELALDQPGWRAVNGTIGVVGLVGGGSGMPAAMPGKAMDALLAQCCEGLWQPDRHAFAIGDTVRIADGPFADFTARIDSLDDKGRARLLLDVLGGGLFQCDARSLTKV